MATIKEITAMCRNGQVEEAYALAKSGLEGDPKNAWNQRSMGWVLYHRIRKACETRDIQAVVDDLRTLKELDQLKGEADTMIFESIDWKLAELMRKLDANDIPIMDRLLEVLKDTVQKPSKGYSALLQASIGHDYWPNLGQWLAWWDVEKNLMPEDFVPFQTEQNRKTLCLAERAAIAYAKTVLKSNNSERRGACIAFLEKLMEEHPEMTYPGYFCGKLMMIQGATREKSMEILLPFVKKKKSEFWVWQLLAELYKDDGEMQKLCLLRAAGGRAKESFLGKVRLKLVYIFLQEKDYASARFHLDKIKGCLQEEGRNPSFEVQNLMREPWATDPNPSAPPRIDYMGPTNRILLQDTNRSVAIVTGVDTERKRIYLTYGLKLTTSLPASRVKQQVTTGSILEMQWMKDGEKIQVLDLTPIQEIPSECFSYIRAFTGRIYRKPDKEFATIQDRNTRCFIAPPEVKKYNIQGNEKAVVLGVYQYNKKKEEWGWRALVVNRDEEVQYVLPDTE